LQDITLFYEQVRKPLDQVTLTDLQDYADWLRDEKGLAVTTRAWMLSTIKSLLTFAKNTGRICFNLGTALQLKVKLLLHNVSSARPRYSACSM